MRLHPILLTVLLALAGCEPGGDDRSASGTTAPPSQMPASPAPATPDPRATSPAPLTASGPSATVAVEEDAALQSAAAVIRVDPLARQGTLTVKLFGMGGGDPAMNGLQTYLAVFRSPAEGWAVFPVGDVLNYRILSETPGRVDLEITESRLDSASGEIGEGTRRIIVGWAPPADGAAPTAITVTPAR